MTSDQRTVTRDNRTVTCDKGKDFEFDFERLSVYKKALDFIDKIFAEVNKLPKEYRYSLGSNLIRAGLSVANNLAEGSDKISHKERAKFYSISSDSARECVSVFNVLKRQELIDENLYHQLRCTAREITSMIHGLINRL